MTKSKAGLYDLIVIGDGQVAVTCHHISSSQLEFGREYYVYDAIFDAAGSAALCAGAASRLGLKTALLTKIGNDFFAQFALRRWRQSGIDTSYITKTENVGTSFSGVVLHKSGMWTAITYLGANGVLTFEDVKSFIELCRQSPPKLLHLGGYNKLTLFLGKPAIEVLKIAKEAGLLVTFDVVWDPEGWAINRVKVIRETISYTDVCLFNLNEAKIISGKKKLADIAKELLRLGSKVVAIKLGNQGSFIATEQEMFKAPAFKVKVEDSSGAGDAYNAGFIYGLLANAMGALKTTYVPRGWAFHWEVKRKQINEFLHKHNISIEV
jgi:sugar/nucleoside kinase (ribokinase family)